MAAPLQRGWPQGADLSAHGGPPPPFCLAIEAGLGEVVRAAQQAAAPPPLAGADPAPRWTLRRLVGWVEARFGRTCCREDRKSTRLNSSHANISYAVFCLKKKSTENEAHTA